MIQEQMAAEEVEKDVDAEKEKEAEEQENLRQAIARTGRHHPTGR